MKVGGRQFCKGNQDSELGHQCRLGEEVRDKTDPVNPIFSLFQSGTYIFRVGFLHKGT